MVVWLVGYVTRIQEGGGPLNIVEVLPCWARDMA